jgi:hypothetical protein
VNDYSFSVLPPHFNEVNGPVLTVEEWEEILPGYTTFYPSGFRVALPYLLASLSYHQEWLQSTLSPRHPLFLQRVWRDGVLPRVAPFVCSGLMKNLETGLRATGVPPSVVLCGRMLSLEEKMIGLRECLLDRISDLPTELKTLLIDSFEVNGVRPLTSNEIHEMFASMQQRMLSEILSIVSQRVNPVPAREEAQSVAPETDQRFQVWSWGGAFHPVPQDFVLPTCNVKTFWDLWWEGDPSRRISPYKNLTKRDFFCKKQPPIYSKGKRVVKELLSLLPGNGASLQISSLSKIERDGLYKSAFSNLCTAYYPQCTSQEDLDARRVGDLTFVTWYDKMTKAKRTRTE